MSISAQGLTGDEAFSIREIAENREVDEPISIRYLIENTSPSDVIQYDGELNARRDTWKNWVSDFGSKRVEYAPRSKEELFATVDANKDGNIKAVGSGHSHSKAPVPKDRYIDLRHLTGTLGHNGWLKSTDDLPVDDTKYLQRLKGGTRIRDINRQILAPKGLALENMGSFDGQTLAGAINTGTHGTGIGLSTIADTVESVELVTVMPDQNDQPVTRMFRIEPSEGITDPDAFSKDQRNHGMELIQDDDTFYSVVVGYGSMGVAYSYTIKVRDFYWLREYNKGRSWKDYGTTSSGHAGALESDGIDAENTPDDEIPDGVPDLLKGPRHTQFLVNHPEVHKGKRGSITVLERSHEIIDGDDIPDAPDNWEEQVVEYVRRQGLNKTDTRWPPERTKSPLRDFLKAAAPNFHPLKSKDGWGGNLNTGFFNPTANSAPFIGRRTSSAWYIALRRLRDRNVDDKNYEAMPEPPKPPAISTDVAVPLERLPEAVEAVFDVTDPIHQRHEVDQFYRKAARTVAGWFGADGPQPKNKKFKINFASPMGIRFIAPSEHYLSPEHDRWSAMIEVPFPVEAADANLQPGVPNVGKDQMLTIAKDALAVIENELIENYDGRPHLGKTNSLGRDDLDRMYDEFDTWLQTYRRFNSFGIFDSPWTDQFDINQDE